MRTPQSEKEDLDAYEAQTTKKKLIINGVSKPPLIVLEDYMSLIIPTLHCALGETNFVAQFMYKVK